MKNLNSLTTTGNLVVDREDKQYSLGIWFKEMR